MVRRILFALGLLLSGPALAQPIGGGAGGGGGGGGIVTNAGTFATQDNGTNTTAIKNGIGTIADAAWSGSGDGSTIAALKAIYNKLAGTVAISAASLPLPSGAATAANQTTANTSLSTIATNTTNTAAGSSASTALPVQGVTGGIALPVAAASLPLPSGAATAANQTTANTSLSTIATNTAITAAGSSASSAQAIQGVTGGIAIPSSSTQSGTWTVQPGNTANTTPWIVTAGLTATITNPTSTLTRPGDTIAYAQNDLIASSTGTPVVPSFAIANSAGGACLGRLRLTTNKTSGWDGVTLTVRLWLAAPTYANGDNGAYSVSTGAANYLASLAITLSQFGDGASGVGQPSVGNNICIKLPGSLVYWDLQNTWGAALTPGNAQTFTVTPEFLN